MTQYTLYKNPIQDDTRAIVRYLESIGKPCPPTYIIERNYPTWVTSLPSIRNLENLETEDQFVGFAECVKFWENATGVSDLYECVNDP